MCGCSAAALSHLACCLKVLGSCLSQKRPWHHKRLTRLDRAPGRSAMLAADTSARRRYRRHSFEPHNRPETNNLGSLAHLRWLPCKLSRALPRCPRVEQHSPLATRSYEGGDSSAPLIASYRCPSHPPDELKVHIGDKPGNLGEGEEKQPHPKMSLTKDRYLRCVMNEFSLLLSPLLVLSLCPLVPPFFFTSGSLQ